MPLFFVDLKNYPLKNRKEELDFSLTDYMLQEIHDDGYLETLKNLEKMSQTEIDDLCRTFDSIAMTPDSFKVAHEAAAYCVTLTKKVAEGEVSAVTVIPK